MPRRQSITASFLTLLTHFERASGYATEPQRKESPPPLILAAVLARQSYGKFITRKHGRSHVLWFGGDGQ